MEPPDSDTVSRHQHRARVLPPSTTGSSTIWQDKQDRTAVRTRPDLDDFDESHLIRGYD